MNALEYLEKLRALPENKKRFIFFAIMIFLSLIMFLVMISSTNNNFSKISESVGAMDLSVLKEPKFKIDLTNDSVKGY